MNEFQPTEESHIVRLIHENIRQPELGEVTKVFEHTDDDDGSNFEVNVQLRDADKTRRRIPIATNPFNGAVSVPKRGDTVLVSFLDGKSQSPIVTGVVHNNRDRAPTGEAGVYRLRKGDLYLEMHPDGDWVRIAKKDDDDGEPLSKVELTSDGEVNITGHRSEAVDEDVTASGDGTTTTFTLDHSLGQTPSTAHIEPTSADAVSAQFYLSNKSTETVEITYTSAPPSGTDNLQYDITTIE